ncbi:MAG: phosphoribosylformylglycinamidine synthase subunit PurQ [Thermoplasmatales archaeon]|nr:phosphoribosylformylglycinamidine synthase subunit PurQ [Thermoplasmatales archaeon]
MKVCVLRIEGTNCEDEMAEAFRMVGATPEKVHLKQLAKLSPSDTRRNLEDYDILALPGGFSAGDYVRAGAIFAARIKAAVGHEIKAFDESDKPMLGVCNGFQVLVELGLLPAIETTMTSVPTAALYNNDSGRFECRPTLLRNDNRRNCTFTSDIPRKKVLMFPSAHGEGKLMSMDADFVWKLEDNDQIVFRYTGEDGEEPEYPWNPNGSVSDIAGICNSSGNVLGLMPHPERAMTRFTHPDWTRGYDTEEGDGRAVFTSVINNLLG